MNVSYLENHLKGGGSLPRLIVDEMDIYKYKLDNRAMNTLNKVLGTSFKAVYRKDREIDLHQWQALRLNIDPGNTFVVRSDNTVFAMQNSEWFTVVPITPHTYG